MEHKGSSGTQRVNGKADLVGGRGPKVIRINKKNASGGEGWTADETD